METRRRRPLLLAQWKNDQNNDSLVEVDCFQSTFRSEDTEEFDFVMRSLETFASCCQNNSFSILAHVANM
jgi:hypothetical protein